MAHESLLIENQICFRIYSLERAIQQAYKPMLDDLGITYPQYLVLLVLWEKKEVTVGQLCEVLGLDTGTISPLVKRMEKKGLVTRNRLPSDERTVLISLSGEGVKLEEKARSIPRGLGKCLFGNLKEEQVEKAYAHLRSVLDDTLKAVRNSCIPKE